MSELSLAEARRIALAAQGFDCPRPEGPAGAEEVARTLRRLGVVQIDCVNVLVPAHYVPAFSRLGPYDRALFDALVYQRREFTEQWAHEAAIVPLELWPLFRHRRETHRIRPWGFGAFLESNPEYVALVLEEVRARGPLSADDLPDPNGTARRLDQAWFGTVPRAVLEALFGRGVLAVAARRRDFARVFDVAERVIPPEHRGAEVPREEAQRELLNRAARACGIAVAADLADYWRMPLVEARPRIQELVESGELIEVRVEGWAQPAYRHRSARAPERVDACALLSPFDPLLWYRPRVERLFGFEYRIEIYLPEEQRTWGYYVLPFLLGDRLVGRVDLKAERAEGRLAVRAAHLEPGCEPEAAAAGLACELRLMAKWLQLDRVRVGRRGNLARALGKHLLTRGV